MKSILYFAGVLLIILTSCGGQNPEDEKTFEENLAEEVPEIIENDAVSAPEQSLKLEDVISKNNEALEQLRALIDAIENKEDIKTLEEVEKVFSHRDNLIKLLMADDDFNTYMEEGDRLYEEFESLGIHIIEAEGLFFGLDKANLFEDIIEKVADEPYILKNKIDNLYAASHGSEYPYLDLSEEMQIIPLAEKMLLNYPDHKYNIEIAKILENALNPLTDVHLVKSSHKSYIVGGYAIGEYPGATDIKYHKEFVEKNEKSKFADVIDKIVKSISVMGKSEFDSLYFIQVPDLSTTDSIFADEKLNTALFNLQGSISPLTANTKYLWLGIDIPHSFYLRDGDETNKVIVYRFSTEKENLVESLTNIQAIIPSAELVEYELTETDKKNRY